MIEVGDIVKLKQPYKPTVMQELRYQEFSSALTSPYNKTVNCMTTNNIPKYVSLEI